jgi:GAF domain-containing protein
MRERISSWLAPSIEDPDLRRRQYLLNLVLAGLAGPGFLFGVVMAVLWALGRTPITGAAAGLGVQPFYLLAYWLGRRGRVRLAAFLPVVGVFAVMAGASYQLGVGHVTLIGYAMATLTAGILIGVGAALAFTLLSTVTYLLVGMAQVAGQLPAPLSPSNMYLSNAIGLGLGLSVMVIFDWISNREIGLALDRERELSTELRGQRSNLEQRVAERTETLRQRSEKLEAAGEVARTVAGLRDVARFVDETVRLISERFGFYHAAIYLMDEARAHVVLQAASSAVGRRLLDSGSRLRVGEVGVIGQAAAWGVTRRAFDFGEDAVDFAGSELSTTRSEMALPLRVGDQVIGVLDLQSEEAAAFADEDVALLQTMADQIALSLENIRLLNGMQLALEELEAAYGQYTQRLWQRGASGAGQSRGYRYRRLDVEPVDEEPMEASQARRNGQPIVLAHREGDDGERPLTTLAVPMKIREHVVGALNLRFEGEGIASGTVALMEEVANRLALALESARLYEDAQRRAAREQTLADVTRRMRESLDVDAVLQNAVREMRQALDAAAVEAYLTEAEP